MAEKEISETELFNKMLQNVNERCRSGKESFGDTGEVLERYEKLARDTIVTPSFMREPMTI